MPKLRVPEKRRSSFKLIAEASPAQLDELIGELSRLPATVQIYELASQAVLAVKQMSAEQAQEIVDTILSLFTPFANSGRPLSELLAELADAGSFADGKPVLAVDDRPKFIENLTALLSIQSLQTAAMGISIRSDRPRTLISNALTLEAEPIFALNDRKTLSGMITSYTLKLEYFEENERKNFFVTLDNNDLDLLCKRLELAKEEGRAFHAALKLTGLPVLAENSE